jgi:hypothetical protein
MSSGQLPYPYHQLFETIFLIMMDDAGLIFREHARAQPELVQLAMAELIEVGGERPRWPNVSYDAEDRRTAAAGAAADPRPKPARVRAVPAAKLSTA